MKVIKMNNKESLSVIEQIISQQGNDQETAMINIISLFCGLLKNEHPETIKKFREWQKENK